MKKITLFSIGIILLSISACKRKSVENYYFNCKINGQYYEPDKQGGLGEYPLTAKLQSNETILSIRASRSIQNIILGIYDTTIIKEQVYQFTKTPYTSQAIYDDNLGVDDYRTDSTFTGFTTITLLDKQNMIVEGNFYFNAYSPVLNDTIQITDGKFRLNYSRH